MRITKNLAAFSFIAVAALSIPSTGALAVTCATTSDTLTLHVGDVTQTATICEGTEPASTSPLTATFSVTDEYAGIISGVQTFTRVIALLDPGTSQISDLVTVTINQTQPDPTFQISVTLRSDGEAPLTGFTFDASLPETGQAQNLTSLIFGSVVGDGLVLPTITVTSDVERVPEPASLAIFGAGLAGLGLLRRRRRKQDA
jgi:PEP-CTERM motif